MLSRITLLTALLLIATGCGLINPPPTPTPTPPPDAWLPISPGLDARALAGDEFLGQLQALRIDPAYHHFRVHYQPGAPLRLPEWRALLPDAVAIINANFFDPQGRALGLLVSDGAAVGVPYTDRGGTFLVRDGIPAILRNPIDTNQRIEQAAQAFPMLVADGVTIYQPGAQERITRRTVIAQDATGRIILMVTPFLGATLADLSAYLPTTDLGLVHALNLDGGGSSMLFYARPGADPLFIPSIDPVPAVIAVYPR